MGPNVMSSFSDSPIYVSEKSVKNLWQDYRVFPDRIQLRCWIIPKTFVIRAEDIVDININPAFSWGALLQGKLKIKLAIKLDLADLYEHVEIHRKTGLFKYLRITPDNPANFVAACRSMKPV
jgi:hypothetical protein